MEPPLTVEVDSKLPPSFDPPSSSSSSTPSTLSSSTTPLLQPTPSPSSKSSSSSSSAAAAAAAAPAMPEQEQDEVKRMAREDVGRSVSARSYAPLPFQLRRLFFNPNAPEVAKIAGRQLRLVHRDPNVYTIDDFLNDSEFSYMEQLIEQHYGKFRASYTDDNVDEQYVSESRTSAFISLRKSGDAKVRSVENRAAEIVGLTSEYVEPLQMVGYRRNDRFGLHHDLGTLREDMTVEAVSPRRLITFFVYLNNLPRGQGHTIFPKLDNGRFSMQPKRLKALLWCNVLENGQPDTRLLHRADPVREEGLLKFGINIWIVDKSLQALALSDAGVTLNTSKIVPERRTILAMIDEACAICKGRDRRHLFKSCDHCNVSYHRGCLPVDAQPPARDTLRRYWTCPDCEGKKPRPGDFCEVCEGGDREHLIVLCETCGRGSHTTCLGLRKVPKEDYYCDKCVERQEIKAMKEKAKEEGGCQLCGGDEAPEATLLCDGCDLEFHLACIKRKKVPRGKWFCRPCVAQKKKDKKRKLKERAEQRKQKKKQKQA